MIFPISAMTQEELLKYMEFSNNPTIREIAAKFRDHSDEQNESAYEEGYEEGYDVGYAEGEENVNGF